MDAFRTGNSVLAHGLLLERVHFFLLSWLLATGRFAGADRYVHVEYPGGIHLCAIRCIEYVGTSIVIANTQAHSFIFFELAFKANRKADIEARNFVFQLDGIPEFAARFVG